MSVLKLKCTIFDFRWGSALPQTPELYLRGLLQGEEREEGGDRKGRKRRGREGRGQAPKIFWRRTAPGNSE